MCPAAMSCGGCARHPGCVLAMRVTPLSGRFTTLVLLLLIAAVQAVEAQQYACSPIARGDTAAGLALRLTGHAANRHADWFQIVDPLGGRTLPKGQYDLVHAGWHACVARDVSGAVSRTPPRATAGWSRDDLELAWRVGLIVSMLLFGFSRIETYVTERRIPPDMRRAGEAFVHAFARPLIDTPTAPPPISARLRYASDARQLEILIAPNRGRTYPNLSDHKTNVEYDVDRLVQLLGRPFVAGDGLRAEGKWVVIPIRQADLKEAGDQ
jgi:hypothetical protein